MTHHSSKICHTDGTSHLQFLHKYHSKNLKLASIIIKNGINVEKNFGVTLTNFELVIDKNLNFEHVG